MGVGALLRDEQWKIFVDIIKINVVPQLTKRAQDRIANIQRYFVVLKYPKSGVIMKQHYRPVSILEWAGNSSEWTHLYTYFSLFTTKLCFAIFTVHLWAVFKNWLWKCDSAKEDKLISAVIRIEFMIIVFFFFFFFFYQGLGESHVPVLKKYIHFIVAS